MEVTGLAVGVAGLAGLFSVCLDSLSRFQTYRESDSETHVLDTRFRAARARFEQWGVNVGISNGRLQPDHHHGLDNIETANLIESILQIIAKTICDESILQRARTGSRLQSGQLGGLSQSKSKRLKWALGGKESRLEQVDVFEKFVQQLYNLIQPEEKGQSFEGLESTAWVEDIRQMLAKIEQGIKFEEQRDVLSWLGGSPPSDKYEDSLSRRVATTCEWIFDRPTFKSWVSPTDSSKPSLLWINGPAGFGKTVLSAHIVHYLCEALDTLVAHFFFTSDHESREDPFTALRSWQCQIAAKSNDAFECIRRVRENDCSERASRRTLVNLLKQVVKAVSGCVLIADGLDECSQLGNGDTSVAKFLRDITNATTGTDVRLLLISRDEPEIREALEGNKETFTEYRIRTDDVAADTAAFSQALVNKRLSNKSEDLRSTISQAMTDRCQGQFLWIRMQEQSLRNGMSKKRLHETVENTPSGLDRLYDHNWNRIRNMSDSDRDRAFALLRWTAFTFSPLAIYEVVEAVLIDQFGELDPDDYPENVDDQYVRTEIVGLCGPLLEVRDDSNDLSPGYRALHIPHFSVRQFLVKHLPAPACIQANQILNRESEKVHHTAIARACVQYLSLPQVWLPDNDPQSSPKSLLLYVSANWMRHARLGFMDPSLLELAKTFLQDKGRFKSLVDFFGQPENEGAYMLQLRPFEYVLYNRWIDMADYLIADADVNEIGALGRSPIFAACGSGSAELAHVLIRRGADLSIRDIDGSTCLHLAAACGFEDIVRILVESKVCLSPQDDSCLTPLHYAAEQGHTDCSLYLVEQGADVNIMDKFGWTVVHSACRRVGQDRLLRSILQNGPDTLATDHQSDLGSPLHFVAESGDVEMARVLFEYGAVPSLFTPEILGNLPLHDAVLNGHADLLEVFLQHGAEKRLSVPNAAGNTALHLACGVKDRDKIISLLLRPGVEQSLLMGDKKGDTPLHVASRKGYASYVKLILQYSEPKDQRPLQIRNRSLETPLIIASFKGHTEVVRTLLEHGAETTLHVLNCLDMSPLWAASLNGSIEIVKELLSYGAGTTIATPSLGGETPLYTAAACNEAGVLSLLLDVPNVPVNPRTTYGLTPLFVASRNGYHDIAELLLSADSIDKDSTNWLGLSPLFAAVANGHLEVTNLLLSKGAHLQPSVSIGRDLLWWAQRSNRPDLIQLLKTHEDFGFKASGSCKPLPVSFADLQPLSRNAKTVYCRPGLSWYYVCTLSVRDDQWFRCVECGDSLVFLCSECFTRGFKLCPRSHILVPFNLDVLNRRIAEGPIDSLHLKLTTFLEIEDLHSRVSPACTVKRR
ncbi:hypothetical protein LB504_010683 [Fusarium proliferatum]|nr:hypothetical protein LB504_010683 [Fusarium proliferatum]